jgi:dGTPase
VGEQIISRHRLGDFEAADIGAICAAACLAHDIGNPPFGHSGEDGIRHWASHGQGQTRVASIPNPAQQEDFLAFEGNAQGFRVLTRLQSRDNPGGLQLTSATLAAFTKYPREAWLTGNTFPGVSARKQGFCHQDRPTFESVAEATGLIRRHPQYAIWHRHPLAFLVEAADDICYRVIDIEDGFRLGHIGYQEALALFLDVLPDRERQQARLGNISGDKEGVEFLRAKVINQVVTEAKDCFLDLEPDILAGRFDEPLLSQIPHRQAMDRLIEVGADKLYCAPEVVEIETAGFEVMSELLTRFIQALDDIALHGSGATPKSRMMVRLIPEQFIGPSRIPEPDLYGRLLRLTDFVAGMTDSYAVSTYKKLTGISLPNA